MNREIVILFAIDVPCYGWSTTQVPAEVDIGDVDAVGAWVKANASRLADQCEYDPEWEYSDGLRIMEAKIEDGDVFSDTEYPEGLPKRDVGSLAIEVVTQQEDEIIRSNLSRETVMRLLAVIGK